MVADSWGMNNVLCMSICASKYNLQQHDNLVLWLYVFMLHMPGIMNSASFDPMKFITNRSAARQQHIFVISHTQTRGWPPNRTSSVVNPVFYTDSFIAGRPSGQNKKKNGVIIKHFAADETEVILSAKPILSCWLLICEEHKKKAFFVTFKRMYSTYIQKGFISFTRQFCRFCCSAVVWVALI